MRWLEIKQKFMFALSGIVLGVACIYPDNYLAPLFVMLTLSGLFYYVCNLKNVIAKLFLTGFLFHLTSMWWLGPTMERFGGMPGWIAFSLMLLHSFLSALQFPLAYYLAAKIKKIIDLKFALIIFWIILEQWFPRLFPWGMGNFFIHFTPISAWGELIGVVGVSLLVLLIALCFSQIVRREFNNRKNLSAFLAVILLIGVYTDYVARQTERDAKKLSALVVQGNLSIEEKGKQEYLEVNIEKYRELSEVQGIEKFDFIIWPESVVSAWLNQATSLYSADSPDPLPQANVPLVYGGLSYLRSGAEAKMYNSVLVREVGGKVSAPYSKKILMPFGEYVPFTKMFPWIRDLTPIKRDFNMGESEKPILLSLSSNQTVMIGPSVCYEDLSSDLGRMMAQGGAGVLINITNDAWYGNSPAPYQHDLLARFRAIETRKYFIRSTNTGLTTLINSRGQRVENLPMFKEERRIFEFPVLMKPTFYVKNGNFGLYVLMIAVFVVGWRSRVGP